MTARVGAERERRRFDEASRQEHGTDATDQRAPFEIDRDRILYCSAFRRLAGVTQVVTSTEGHVFHNRLTHSMKAAQIGRRLAQRLLRESTQLEVDPEVVEAAALAHDLGHPPFGHAGETTLNALVTDSKNGSADGFEGNAQTFRILVKLAWRRPSYPGLNLSRATLRAVIKYPWYKGGGPEGKEDKWNAYESEREDFEFALGAPAGSGTAKSDEGQLMEWADDIAYSVHDLEDFYRAGLIPLDLLIRDRAQRQAFVQARHGDLAKLGVSESAATSALGILELANPELDRRYVGDQAQRAALRLFTSRLIARYVKGVRVITNQWPPVLEMPNELQIEIAVLKELMRHYVFGQQALAAQQHGHKKVLTDLFNAFCDATHSRDGVSRSILPVFHRERLEQLEREVSESAKSALRTRTAADVVAGLTEHQAIALHRRLLGLDPGTIRDAIHA